MDRTAVGSDNLGKNSTYMYIYIFNPHEKDVSALLFVDQYSNKGMYILIHSRWVIDNIYIYIW